jgi:hypothetical protein
VVICFGFCGRDVPDGFEKAWIVEPVDPFEGCVFDGSEIAPRAATMDAFALEEADDRLGEGFFITVTDAAKRWFDTSFGQSFSVFDRQILASAVAVVNQPDTLCRAAFMGRLFKGIQNEPGMRRGAETPADDLASIGIDGENYIANPFKVATYVKSETNSMFGPGTRN